MTDRRRTADRHYVDDAIEAQVQLRDEKLKTVRGQLKAHVAIDETRFDGYTATIGEHQKAHQREHEFNEKALERAREAADDRINALGADLGRLRDDVGRSLSRETYEERHASLEAALRSGDSTLDDKIATLRDIHRTDMERVNTTFATNAGINRGQVMAVGGVVIVINLLVTIIGVYLAIKGAP